MRKVDTFSFVEKTSRSTNISDLVPTLIVGRELAESICGKEKIHVLDKQIGKNLFWTFSKLEKRSEYETDIENFNNYVLESISKNITYRFVNLYLMPFERLKNLISFITNDKEKHIYLTDNHIYIYYNRKVIGFSVDQLKFNGIGRDKITRLLKRGKNNMIFDDDKFIPYEVRRKLRFDNILMPYLHFLKHN